MDQNASFVFFKKLKTRSPLGTQRVPLTPRRSLAVDQRFIPLGVPLWVKTTYPNPKNPNENLPFRHLMIAQDTGGAIRGIIRGDIYWGSGKDATYIAGHMKNAGRFWILLPKTTPLLRRL